MRVSALEKPFCRLLPILFSLLLGFVSATLATAQSAPALKIVAGNGQVICPLCNSNPVGFYQPLVVQAVDTLGNPLAGASVTWTILMGSGSFAESGSNTFTATTDAGGLSKVHYAGFSTITGNVFQSYTQSVITAASGQAAVTFYETQALQDPLNPNFQPLTAYAVPVGTLLPGTLFSGQLGTKSSSPIQVMVVGENGIGIPNVGVALANHQSASSGPIATCDSSANPTAGPGLVLTDQNGLATCTPVFGGIPGNGSFVVDIGGVVQSDPAVPSPAYIVLPVAGGLNLTVTPGATLSVSKTHTGSFSQGQRNALYTVTVGNASSASPTSGTISVTENLPAALSLVSMAGVGWTCAGAACSRSDALAAGAAYPPITVTVNVAANAPAQVTNQVSVTGGGSVPIVANDPTAIGPVSPCSFSLSPAGATVGSGSGTTGSSISGSFTLVATNCTAANTWTAASDSPRLLITSGAAGNGAAPFSVISYSMYTNSSTLPRTAHINVAGQTFTITQTGSTENQAQRVVRALYQTILGREPDSFGWAFWTGSGAPKNPVNGAVLFNQMADGFYTSPEFKNTGFAVLSFYQAILGRQPTFGEWLPTVTQLRQSSLSAFQLVNSLSAGLSNAAFVQQVIQNAWGRAASPGEVSLYSNQLNAGLARVDFLNGLVFQDPQFVGRTNPQFVTMLYYTILLRDPDQAGLNFWVTMATAPPGQPGLYYVTPSSSGAYGTKLAIIGQAVPPNPVLLGFLGSPEFQSLIQ